MILTTVVGSYPQPDSLVDRSALAKTVPRVRMPSIWRLSGDRLRQAQDDATVAAIRDMEAAGIDVVTDGEIRRESYSNYFVSSLEGLDLDNPATITDHRGQTTEVPRVVGAIRRTGSVSTGDLRFLREHTDRAVKVTLPGPFTLAQQAHDDFYGSIDETALAFADVVNEELADLQEAGADVVQLDEPWLRNDPEAAERFAVQAIDRALEGITITTALHMCFGYAALVSGTKPTAYSFLPQLADSIVDQISIEAAQPRLDLEILRELSNKTVILGVLDLADPEIETPDRVADRIREGLRFIEPGRLVAAPDCGMKYLPRDTAFGKLQALAAGARIVRAELT